MKTLQQLFDLTGKTALVTGSGRGLGQQMARTLSNFGARVIVTDRNIEKLATLVDELKNIRALELDVSNKSSVTAAFAKLEEYGEKVDICINNAGIAKATSIFEDDPEGDFEQVIQVNLIGLWYVTKEVANHMKKHQIAGSIINIGSINGAAFPSEVGAAYNVSKAGVLHLTKSLVGQLSPYNIRINAISPGFFPTDMTKNMIESHGEVVATKIPLGFVAEQKDLDALVLYLASNNASRYVTGSTFTIDGGISWGGII